MKFPSWMQICSTDLRLREIMQRPVPFGNVAVIVLGDPMQMRPISGRYIFHCPRNQQFLLTYELDSLWKKFDCLTLEINHRQGEDRKYAETLNRIRVGEEIEDDIQILKDKVRNEKHLDIRNAKDALYIYGTNQKVNQMNNKTLRPPEEMRLLSMQFAFTNLSRTLIPR